MPGDLAVALLGMHVAHVHTGARDFHRADQYAAFGGIQSVSM